MHNIAIQDCATSQVKYRAEKTKVTVEGFRAYRAIHAEPASPSPCIGVRSTGITENPLVGLLCILEVYPDLRNPRFPPLWQDHKFSVFLMNSELLCPNGPAYFLGHPFQRLHHGRPAARQWLVTAG